MVSNFFLILKKETIDFTIFLYNNFPYTQIEIIRKKPNLMIVYLVYKHNKL